MNRGNEGLLNAISIAFMVATGVVILVVILLLILGGGPEEEAVIPALMALPTVTETFTPTPTDTPVPPSPTPSATPTDTATFTPRPTDAPTLTPMPIPSATITQTPSITPTLDVTFTLTPSPTPTGPSPTAPPPLPFAAPDTIQFTRNFANSAGCAWQGVGGQVLALGGGAFTNPLQVHVYSAQQDYGRVFTGSNSAYGQSGFEVRVANSINPGTYFVQLESRNGIPISSEVQVTFPGDCDQNVALINFEQVRSLNP